MGKFHESGIETEQNYLEAKKFYELSAQYNNSDAMNYLGDLYFYGKGVEQNYLKAKDYYEISSQQYNSFAQNNISFL